MSSIVKNRAKCFMAAIDRPPGHARVIVTSPRSGQNETKNGPGMASNLSQARPKLAQAGRKLAQVGSS